MGSLPTVTRKKLSNVFVLRFRAPLHRYGLPVRHIAAQRDKLVSVPDGTADI
jgi:hypothetical protein